MPKVKPSIDPLVQIFVSTGDVLHDNQERDYPHLENPCMVLLCLHQRPKSGKSLAYLPQHYQAIHDIPAFAQKCQGSDQVKENKFRF